MMIILIDGTPKGCITIPRKNIIFNTTNTQKINNWNEMKGRKVHQGRTFCVLQGLDHVRV